MINETPIGLSIREQLEAKKQVAEANVPPGMKLIGWLFTRENGDMCISSHVLYSPASVPVFVISD